MVFDFNFRTRAKQPARYQKIRLGNGQTDLGAILCNLIQLGCTLEAVCGFTRNVCDNAANK